ncbi:MAG: DUF1232 domain-containing protein [Clostridia bacterium]|nr:DUF1232 domain-containing protein [Clostridia bacterium]
MNGFVSEETQESIGSFEETLKAAEDFAPDGRIRKKLTKEKVKAQIDKFSEKAKQIIDNPEKVSAVLEKAISLCDDLGQVRFIGKYFRDISLICSMINDYICKCYTKVPMATVITLLAAVLYFISPIDIIPDFLPLVGHLDDMVVLAFVQDAARLDLKKYEKWKKENEKSGLISEGKEEI